MRIGIDDKVIREQLKRGYCCKCPHSYLSNMVNGYRGDIEKELKDTPIITIDEILDVAFEEYIIYDYLEKVLRDHVCWNGRTLDNGEIIKIFNKAVKLLPDYAVRKKTLENYIETRIRLDEEKDKRDVKKLKKKIEDLGYKVKIRKN